MRALAILAVYNERRFLAGAVEHLIENGLEVYLIDHGSTDGSLDLVRHRLGRGLAGVETHARTKDVFDWSGLLRRKAEIAASIDADWVMHVDADEIHTPRLGRLIDVYEQAEAAGYNAVEFQEFTFIPTREAPDHDHEAFRETMNRYYPFRPFEPHLVRAWKGRVEVDLVASAGHEPRFDSRRIFPERIPMKHYLFLSVPHALEKYRNRRFAMEELGKGWHGWRAAAFDAFELPPAAELSEFTDDARLDDGEPKRLHYIDAWLRGVPWS